MEIKNIKVYTNESSLRNPTKIIGDMIKDLLGSRELSMQLAIRDIRAQYRQAFLGFLWVFLLPLANTAVWLFIQGSGVVQISDTELPYPVYVFSGTILWAIFMEAMNSPLRQTTAAKSMLSKINFPREALILSGIYQTFFNAFIKIVILIIVLMLLGVQPSLTIAFFPFTIISLILAGTALGLLLTPIGMLYTDIGKGLPLLMHFLMYISPVVFPMPTIGFAAKLFQINPISPLIITSRNLLTGLDLNYLPSYFLVNVAMIILLFIMWIIYRAAMPILIERMSA